MFDRTPHMRQTPRIDRCRLALLALVAMSAGALAGCNENALDPLPATHSEVHYQGGAAPPVDILWVVDNSGSMEQEQAKLGNNFASFIQYFTALELDFQLAITTTDTVNAGHQGAFQGEPRILTPQTPNLASEFLGAVNVGIQGSGEERGLEGARLALSEPQISTTNLGFLRENAILAIIIVSDEEDQSPLSVAEYVSFFSALKGGDPAKINLSVIAGDVPNGCQSADADADPGARYHEAATALNGVKASICATEFGPVLDQIGSVVAGLATAFPLDFTPVAASIEVRVDGVVIPNDQNTGWYFNETVGGIIFSPAAVPAECAVVEINYQVADYGGNIQNGNNEAPPAQCPAVAFPGGSSLDGGAFTCSVGDTGMASQAFGQLPGIAALLALGVMIFRRRLG